MRVVVAIEQRYDRTPDGAVWTQAMYAHSFWVRYLDVFDEVRVVARVRDVDSVPDDWKRADGESVSIHGVPYYVGPMQYLLKASQVNHAARNSFGNEDAIILRVDSQIADCMEPKLKRTGHPFGVEVVVDPYDIFAPGAVKHPLRSFFRWWCPRQLRRKCAEACAASYVTEKALQRRYPPNPNGFSTHYSSVELPEAAFAAAPRLIKQHNSPIALIAVGTMSQPYKAHDVMIDAFAACVAEGLDLKLTLVGDGQFRSSLEAQADKLGVSKRVLFLGQLTAGEAVRNELDRADLFVMPSRQEGLPRAMIEAMARALPCIGSTVGGIPELLPPEDMVPPGDVDALASKILEIATDPERLTTMSVRNWEKAKDYQEAILRLRRIKFYEYVVQSTEAWLKTRV